MGRNVLVAMSGGVDSSVAAKLLLDAGDNCFGCTMKLYANEDAGISRGHTCCSLDDVEDARSVAFRLGIPYQVFNFSDDFREKVIGNFVDSYCRGITPNPCIECNKHMKFDKLHLRAKTLGYDYVATGHYARISQENGKYVLKKALDPSKDQSYVLYAMDQEQLAHTLFPLGELSKQETRKIAEGSGFINADKPDSQDICFVPDGDYARVIELRTGKKAEPGISWIPMVMFWASIRASSATPSASTGAWVSICPTSTMSPKFVPRTTPWSLGLMRNCSGRKFG